MKCSVIRMKGEMRPSKKRSLDGLRHLVPTFFLVDDSAEELFLFGLATRRTSICISV